MASTANSIQSIHRNGINNTANITARGDIVKRVILVHGMKLAATKNGDPSSQTVHDGHDSFASFVDAALNPEATPTNTSVPNGPLSVPLPTAPIATPEEVSIDLDNPPPELASAELVMATDHSFIETSSGAAARELKRRFDQYLGVGKDVRSPYAITAFVNQHGKQMYRVGARDLSAPAASMEGNELPAVTRTARSKSVGVQPIASTSTQPPPPLPTQPQHKMARRPRMSVHSFFKNGAPPILLPAKPVASDGTRSPPIRKLRKTRSIPNLSSPTPPPEPVPVAAVVPPAPTGRPHAHSVSSADAWPPSHSVPVAESSAIGPPPDTFAEVVFKTAPSTGPPSPMGLSNDLRNARSFHSLIDQSFDGFIPARLTVAQPFGPGIAFDSPGWQSPSHLTSGPPLREMQSFESGVTARADTQPRSSRLGKARAHGSDEDLPSTDETGSSGPATPRASYGPAAETSMHSRYSTGLFDVLQNYKGLPVPERINAAPNPTTIRLSLRDETAVPRDDPRFVIWGEINSDELEEQSPACTNGTDPSTGHSKLSRRKSTRERNSDGPFVRIAAGPQKVLVAATIERWLAQLTSELNYDELLIFFLTYRTYISALDLGHLLICRFHWALGGQTAPGQSDMVRRIVRLRTFIAIRYWLLTFFTVDFVPNRELRLLFANWINSLRKDPILTRHRDAPSIVQKLRKVMVECKNNRTRTSEHKRESSKKTPDPVPPPAPAPSLTTTPLSPPAPVLGDLSNGHFAESLRKAVGKQREEPDEDIDLDFDDVDTDTVDFGVSSTSLSAGPVNSVDIAMLRQPMHIAYLQYGNGVNAGIPTQVALPVAHSTLSRVVVNAIGRLGRWRRVLNYRTTNSRAPLRPPLGLGGACVDASAFDVEAHETGDLLLVKGGVEQYLKMLEKQPSGRNARLVAEDGSLPGMPPQIEEGSEPRQSSVFSEPETILESVAEASEESSTAEEVVAEQPAANGHSSLLSSPRSDHTQPRDSAASADDASQWQVDVVSIDDLDLSDLSSTEDFHAPATSGLRKLPRRLPNRRDFELVRHSPESVSSLGTRAHDSVLSASSVASSASASGGADPGLIQAGPIEAWQMSALVDSLSDDEEAGDVEAALRSLEGQISQDTQRAKQTKVDGWVQSIRDRLAAGQLAASPERHTYSSDEEDYGEVQGSRFVQGASSGSRGDFSWTSSQTQSRGSVVSAKAPVSAVQSVREDEANGVLEAPAFPPGLESPPVPARAARVIETKEPPASAPVPASPETQAQASTVESKAIAADGGASHKDESNHAVERVRSRASSRPSTSASSPTTDLPPLPLNALSVADDPRLFTPPEKKYSKHRSFILSHKSEVLNQHFAMIDRELFLNLKFEELVSQDYVNASQDLNALDWAQFLRERARMRAEGVKPSDLTLIRSRFNLMANFVASEIVLTIPGDRLMIHSKFVRIAWKAYCSKNFNTLVAILAGLDSHWVKRALHQAGVKPGIWESRMLRDLQQWSTSDQDFRHIRQTVEALSEAKSVVVASQDSSASGGDPQANNSSRSRAASELRPPQPPACVPFFGIYLSQLHRFSVLPDLIDPTAPTEPVGIDPLTNTFDPPAHPEVFAHLAPLPPSAQLEPLINVHKQRLIAGVVKSFVAAQHLAIKVQYPTDKKLFQKCLKLRGLDDDTLQRALAVYSGSDV